MSRNRFVLLGLFAFGVFLYFTTKYSAFHPRSPISTPAFVVLVAYLLVVPIILWLINGERFLRTTLFCVWVAYVVLWGIGVYRLYVR